MKQKTQLSLVFKLYGPGYYFSLGGMYQIADNLRVGAQYDNIEEAGDPRIALKAKFDDEHSDFYFKYIIKNDSFQSVYILGYEAKL